MIIDENGYLTLDGMILRPDGSESYRQQMSAPSDQHRPWDRFSAELLGLAGGREFCFDYGKYEVNAIDNVMLLFI